MKEYYDAIIVGTGAAGLYCALNLPERKNVLLITKQEADQSDSFLAQGGICMLRGEEDYNDYFEDTMRAGHYENNKKAVEHMIRSSNSIIRDLLHRKVTFARGENGELAFTREGAHSQPRILFYEDITGKQITQTLLNEAKTKENIRLITHYVQNGRPRLQGTRRETVGSVAQPKGFPSGGSLWCGAVGLRARPTLKMSAFCIPLPAHSCPAY